MSDVAASRDGREVRVGLVVNRRLRRWHLDLVDQIEADGSGRVTGIAAVPSGPPQTPIMTRIMRLETERPVDAPRAQRVDTPETTALAAWARDLALDLVIVADSAVSVPDDVTTAATYGVWTISVAQSGRPDGWDATVDAADVTDVELFALRGGDVRRLRRARVQARATSYRGTLEQLRWASARLVGATIRALSAAGEVAGEGGAMLHPQTVRAPGLAEIARVALLLALRRARERLKEILQPMQWNVGIVHAPIHDFLDPAFEPEIDWLPVPPRSRFFADPFGFATENGLAILVEDVDYRDLIGRISLIEVDTAGRARRPVPVYAREGVHLSYPFLFEHGGHTYMVPESNMGCDLRVLAAESGHGVRRWTEKTTLFEDARLVDASLFEHLGRWWIAASEPSPGRGILSLSLFYADEPFGDWAPHRLNPVKIDVMSARPAGTPFMHDGDLYRPAQDCSQRYGGRTALCRITELTPTSFAEEIVRYVEPNPADTFGGGLHTISAVGDVTLVDGRRDIFIPANLGRIARRLVAAARRRFRHPPRATDADGS